MFICQVIFEFWMQKSEKLKFKNLKLIFSIHSSKEQVSLLANRLGKFVLTFIGK